MINHANAADLVLSPSDHFRKELLRYGVKKQTGVFPNGISNACFPDDPSLKSLKPGEPISIIWHSRVSGEKRIMPFLEALSLFQGKFKLDVYGTGSHIRRAKRFAARNHLNAYFHGDTKLKTVIAALPKNHLDVLVSYDSDTFGMTLIEAEAFGVPVFICDPDMKEIVPPESYVLSRSPSPEDMAAALDDLFMHPGRIQQMGKIMLSHRHEVLVDNRISILIKHFETLIERKKKSTS